MTRKIKVTMAVKIVITRLLIAEVIHRKRNFIILDCFDKSRNDGIIKNVRNDKLGLFFILICLTICILKTIIKNKKLKIKIIWS